MAPPPDLMPELIEDILVRFPADDPACLVRASVVCKPWRRLVCGPAFRRRYRAFHRAPPLLGFLHNGVGAGLGPRFVSTATPSPLALHPFGYFYNRWSVLDCRHGRVLLKDDNNVSVKLVVWDLATGKHKRLPEPPLQFPQLLDYAAAVLCAVRGCDHLDCHGGPFLVVLVDYNTDLMELQSHLYSSETASTWSLSVYQGPGFIPVCKPSVLIGNNIYFLPDSGPSAGILKVDLGKNHLSTINWPEKQHDFEWEKVALMAIEDGSLGFAGIQGSRLCLWSRNVNPEVAGGWMQCRFIELQTLTPFTNRPRVVGSAEGYGIIFVATDIGVFSLDLKSGHVRKVDEPLDDFAIFPFASFYTPDGSSSKLRLPMDDVERGEVAHSVEPQAK